MPVSSSEQRMSISGVANVNGRVVATLVIVKYCVPFLLKSKFPPSSKNTKRVSNDIWHGPLDWSLFDNSVGHTI